MKEIERKEDVTFYEENGKLYQRIKNGEIFPVKNGKIGYKKIKKIKNYIIKYNTNGIYGFSIWKNNVNLEDRYWSLSKVEKFIERCE